MDPSSFPHPLGGGLSLAANHQEYWCGAIVAVVVGIHKISLLPSARIAALEVVQLLLEPQVLGFQGSLECWNLAGLSKEPITQPSASKANPTDGRYQSQE